MSLNPQTLNSGNEQYEQFEAPNRKMYYQYDYRHTDGELFSCVAPTLEKCREKRDKWLYLQALKAYRDNKIVDGLTVYVPDFGLCIIIGPLENLPKNRQVRYDGSSDDTGYSVYATDDYEEYLQFAVL